MEDGVAPYSKQDDFNLDQLADTENFKGFTAFEYHLNFEELFSLF